MAWFAFNVTPMLLGHKFLGHIIHADNPNKLEMGVYIVYM